MKHLTVLLNLIIMTTLASAQSFIPNYTLRGEGEKKVIITHDWMGDTEGNWKFALDYLDYSEFTYAFMDVRGYGKSKEVKGEFTIDEIANDIFAVADKLGWEEFYLVGHSMCGMAAQKAVLMDKTNRIKAVVGLTPVSSAGFPVDDQTKAFFQQVIADKEVASTGYGMLVSDKLSSNWNKQRAERLHALTNKDALTGYMNEWMTQNFFEETKGISKPFLIIYGEDDMESWREKGQREAFEYYKNVTFEGVANAGHYPIQQVPLYTVQLIESYFLKN